MARSEDQSQTPFPVRKRGHGELGELGCRRQGRIMASPTTGGGKAGMHGKRTPQFADVGSCPLCVYKVTKRCTLEGAAIRLLFLVTTVTTPATLGIISYSLS